MKALFDALNIVYDAEERRGLIKLNAVSLAFTAGALVVLLLALGAIVVLPAVMNYLGIETIGGTIIMLARWPALYMVGGPCPGPHLPLWPRPRARTMALDHLGQRLGRPRLDRGLAFVLVVCGEFRQLQQNLRGTRGSRRLDDLDLDIEHGHPRRCGDRRCP
jgi:hypothetical protein